jgi:PiT family inorganic phosphate transporter
MQQIFLWLALFLALGFEFINGFHDTANAVATVIYTKTLRPTWAVLWSGFWNFAGALMSTGAVAYGIINLLPPGLMDSHSIPGIAVIFSFLISAIIWNLGTWWFGLPISSSHTLIGSILGVGIAASFILGTAGINWGQFDRALLSLLISPLVGFGFSYGLMLVAKVFHIGANRAPPKLDEPPPPRMRAFLLATSMGVSFAHGSNDGQKGMGIIMLVLFGLFPQDYHLDPATNGIPFWVKLIVAITLGLGTTIGWKRVVKTIGERIGREHLTYRQGAVDELVAACTIFASDRFGLPVSTTHVLSSGVAGTMIANHSGVQRRTIRNIALAWVLTLPVCVLLGAAVLSGVLLLVSQVVG